MLSDHLKEPLDKYMSQFPKVRIIRLKERQGLIRARLAGAAAATGTSFDQYSVNKSLECLLDVTNRIRSTGKRRDIVPVNAVLKLF